MLVVGRTDILVCSKHSLNRSMDKRKITLIYFSDYWDERWRRRQQLAYRFAQREDVRKVVCVEFPLPLTSFAKFLVYKADVEASARWERVTESGMGRSMLDGKLEILSPICAFPLFRRTLLSRLDKAFLRILTEVLIRRAISDIEDKSSILFWASHPFAADYIGKFNEAMICYDCTEKFSEFDFWVTLRNEVEEKDSLLTQRADLIFVQAEPYLVEKKSLNPKTFLIPNAVDYDLFQNCLDMPEPSDLKGIKRPILGYVGSINSRMDFELLRKTAQVYKDWSLVFIGDVSDSSLIKPIDGLKNDYFLGEKPYNILPSYLKEFNVCLMPYSINLMQSPLKLFDYLASGKPVVSTDIPGLRNFSDVIFVSKTEDEFIKNIGIAADDNNPSSVLRRKRRAKDNSWDVREEQVWDIIKRELSSKVQ